jgi:hypothetical protein
MASHRRKQEQQPTDATGRESDDGPHQTMGVNSTR